MEDIEREMILQPFKEWAEALDRAAVRVLKEIAERKEYQEKTKDVSIGMY